MLIFRKLEKGNNIAFVCFFFFFCRSSLFLLIRSHYRVLVIDFYFLTNKRTNSSSNVTFQPCIEICFSIILLHLQPYSAKIPAHHKTVQEVEVLFSSTARSYLSSAIRDSYFLGLTNEAAREVENGRGFNPTASVNDELKTYFLIPISSQIFQSISSCLIFIMINSMDFNSHFD